MYCDECDRMEWDEIFLDTERCSHCGGYLTSAEPEQFEDDFNDDITEGEKIDA